ncbi:PTS lactose/cellobiose transporter subunit IIA [Longicatena sp. 210702-DFI.1.36]|uniref:PTS lactose/cellobiose transporter subunit IIA n=1 Tax=Longicatena TaxID=1918536 RepID=UPI001D095010|nr:MULTISPECIES: PTS lactose/cellobiose transporter subunit IIA [Longicatena]MCB6266529.1 PTS lactose/cellobiose transporter subunit IIA [Longicatena sp. 210702-DFI.1.160]MCB6317118.1 PTS lactose/cellobiose transporter subunit IIA [Longicatena sp. 210702-DFI.1.100]MCB6431000.1 PTS lactose/cellobiose transporter subunit IIA [Longicatena sp. 210702-DFI.1.36]MCB6434031.1 PTS lactose/cellobiose transporter subunit IIA [Longicatena sp. 210702-DFI.1.249]MCB6440539.1 PTS lactose/cellobiose transporte
MDKTTIEQLNSAAMQIILHAGDCWNLLNEAINDLLDDKSEEEVKDKITQAKKEITKAHVIQTDMIQSSINEEELQTTLLFTHAQDTLMTINSEVNLVQSMIRLYRKLEK